MKSTIFTLAILLALLTSCGKQSSDYKALQAQNDSLLNAKSKLQEEVDGYFSAMNQIDQNIEKIKSTENTISTQPVCKELPEDMRNKINDDMTYLNDMLVANKAELSRLKAKIKKSAFKSSQLEHTISRLTKSLEEETDKVALLQTKLAEKDSIIVKLDTKVDEMGKNIEALSTDNKTKETKIKEKETKIKEQDETIHTAWYVFGTMSELKKQKIVTTEGLFSSC